MRDEERELYLDVEQHILSQSFGHVSLASDYSWMYLAAFPLPRDCSRQVSPILVPLGPLYPLLPPSGVCISELIQCLGRQVASAVGDGWAYLPINVPSWQYTADLENGTSLADFLDAVYQELRSNG